MYRHSLFGRARGVLRPIAIRTGVLGCLSLLVAAALSGCGDKTESPRIVDAETRDVRVVSVDRSDPERALRAGVAIDGVERQLVVTPLRDSPFPVGFIGELMDADGNVLVRLELAWPDDRKAALWLRESTVSPNYTLEARVETVKGRAYEEYIVGGDGLSIDYPLLDGPQMGRAVRLYRDGTLAASTDPRLVEVNRAMESFDGFIAPHKTSPLYGNPEGERLVFLLTDKRVVAAVLGQEPTEDLLPDRRANVICNIAGTCAMLKCRFGGLSNFVCTACGGTAIACLLANWACTFIECG